MNKVKESLTKEEFGQAIKKKLPAFIKPMLATLTHDHFDDPDWIYERKLDGERALCLSKDGDCRLMSRNEKDISFRYPGLKDALEKNKFDFAVDGEIVAFDKDVTSFQKLQKRMHVSSKKEALDSGVKVFYYVFDIPYLQGYDLSGLRLISRKKLLKDHIKSGEPIRHLPYRKKEGIKYHRQACSKGWEGIIAKDGNSHYVHSRSRKWLKFKCVKDQEFIILGYTDPRGSRIGFGALLLGYNEGNKVKYAGEVGTGYSQDILGMLKKKLEDIETERSPLEDQEKISGDDIHWVKPRLVCEVGFTEWTSNGKLRHPRFKGLRDDKEPGDVVKED